MLQSVRNCIWWAQSSVDVYQFHRGSEIESAYQFLMKQLTTYSRYLDCFESLAWCSFRRIKGGNAGLLA